MATARYSKWGTPQKGVTQKGVTQKGVTQKGVCLSPFGAALLGSFFRSYLAAKRETKDPALKILTSIKHWAVLRWSLKLRDVK